MKRALTAIVLIPLVLLVLFKAPMWLFTLLVGVVAMGGLDEYLKLVAANRLPVFKSVLLVVTAVLFICSALANFPPLAPLLGVYAAVAILGTLAILSMALKQEDLSASLATGASNALAVPYIILPLYYLVWLRQKPCGTFLIVFTFVVVWSGDIFAYYFGRAFGRHKLAPRISPGKSWEGAVASIIGSAFLGHMLFVDNKIVMEALWGVGLVPLAEIPGTHEALFMTGLALSVAVNVAAQIGDLVESMIKRGAGVKDSGNLLPGHGGILDRIDALLFALPIIYLYGLTAPCQYISK